MKASFIQMIRLPLVAIIAFALVKCGDNKAAAIPQAEDPIMVTVSSLTRDNHSRTLQYSGLIASNAEARLSFKIQGIVSRIYVKEGDHVVKGQLLASLDLTEIDAQVQQAASNVEKTQRDEGRINNLFKDTVASLEQLQNVRTQVSMADEALRIARFNRQYAQIRASSGGTILQKFMNEGELATAGAAVFLFNGTAQNDWVVRFGVSDRDWASLKKGEGTTVTIDAYPDQRFAGVITKMAEGADPASSTYPVEVKILPAGHKLAPGLFCTLQMQPATSRSIILIPAEALAEGDGRTGYVYTLNADRKTVTKNKVTIAYLENDKIALSSGLENVQEVITGGVGYLAEKSLVKVVNKGGTGL